MVDDVALPVWTFRPNWSEKVVDRLMWLTDVKRSKTGAESRRSVRIDPRRQFDFSPLLEGQDRAYFDLAMSKMGAGEWMVPVWVDGLTVSVDSGDTSIACDTVGRGFLEDGYAVLLGEDARTYERVAITAVTDTTLTLADPVTRNWPRARLYPLRRCYMDGPKVTRRTSKVATANLRFTQIPPESWPDTLAMTAYLGFPVLNWAPNEREDLDLNYDFLRDTFDNESGRWLAVDTGGRSFHSQSFQWLLGGRTDLANFRSLLYTLRGQQKGIWVPSHNADLVLAQSALTGATALKVRSVGMATLGGIPDARKHIQIVLRDGTRIQRQITAVVANVDDTETLTVAALPAGVSIANVQRISFLELMRLAQDDIELEFHTTSVVEVRALFQAFPNIRQEVALNDYPIPNAVMGTTPCGVPQQVFCYAVNEGATGALPVELLCGSLAEGNLMIAVGWGYPARPIVNTAGGWAIPEGVVGTDPHISRPGWDIAIKVCGPDEPTTQVPFSLANGVTVMELANYNFADIYRGAQWFTETSIFYCDGNLTSTDPNTLFYASCFYCEGSSDVDPGVPTISGGSDTKDWTVFGTDHGSFRTLLGAYIEGVPDATEVTAHFTSPNMGVGILQSPNLILMMLALPETGFEGDV